ncbi:FAD:protein FMN transferase [Streptococcus hongkongensis]
MTLETDGRFDPFYKGDYDPTGYIKGWAIEKIVTTYLQTLLDVPEIIAVCLNGGGDMQFFTDPKSEFRWTLAIEDPDHLNKVIAIYQLANGALATSGFSKRGHHTFQEEGSKIKQVTILGDNLGMVDIWATVGLASNEYHFNQIISKHRLSGLYLSGQAKTIFQLGEFHHG